MTTSVEPVVVVLSTGDVGVAFPIRTARLDLPNWLFENGGRYVARPVRTAHLHTDTGPIDLAPIIDFMSTGEAAERLVEIIDTDERVDMRDMDRLISGALDDARRAWATYLDGLDL